MKLSDKPTMNARFPIPALLCLSLFAIATPSIEARATPRLLVGVGEKIADWLARRGVGCTGSKIDSAILARARDSAADGMRLPDLTVAAERYGDEVLKYAGRVPETAPLLARQADTLLPLAQRFGDDVLRLESRVPGLGSQAAERFPRPGDLGRLSALPPDQARTVVGYAGRATDRTASAMLLKGVERTGGLILDKITPGQILAGGLSTSAVIVAWKGADAATSSPELFLQRVAETLRPISLGTGIGIGGGLLLLATALAAKWGLLGALKRKRSGSRDEMQPNKVLSFEGTSSLRK